MLFAAKSGENTDSQLSLFFGPDQGQNRDKNLSLFLGPDLCPNTMIIRVWDNPLSLFLGEGGQSLGFWGENNASKASNASNASNASEASITHLELRSPMFGETCISKLMFEFEIVFS